MGQGYTYTCDKCGESFLGYLGVGFLYPIEYQEVMESARKGELGEKAKEFLERNPQGAINPRKVIACCNECCSYETVPELGMYVHKHFTIPLPPLAKQKRFVVKLEKLLPLFDKLK